MIIWITGLPCSGKTTLGIGITARLQSMDRRAIFLDGDELRRELWPELGFSHANRDENVSRFGFLARLIARRGVIAVVAAVSPWKSSRDAVHHKASSELIRFVEVYVNCPLDVCIQRDVKGMYARALEGKIPNFTGVSDPYQPPLDPDVECKTDVESIELSMDKILIAVEGVECLASDFRGLASDYFEAGDGV